MPTMNIFNNPESSKNRLVIFNVETNEILHATEVRLAGKTPASEGLVASVPLNKMVIFEMDGRPVEEFGKYMDSFNFTGEDLVRVMAAQAAYYKGQVPPSREVSAPTDGRVMLGEWKKDGVLATKQPVTPTQEKPSKPVDRVMLGEWKNDGPAYR